MGFNVGVSVFLIQELQSERRKKDPKRKRQRNVKLARGAQDLVVVVAVAVIKKEGFGCTDQASGRECEWPVGSSCLIQADPGVC
jgi:hypothetical protein